MFCKVFFRVINYPLDRDFKTINLTTKRIIIIKVYTFITVLISRAINYSFFILSFCKTFELKIT
jgi:hypothetical protein